MPSPFPPDRLPAPHRTRVGAALLAILSVALLAALLPGAATAQAADRTVRGGRLDWGIKASFQSYVTGPVAQGSWSLTGGAATTGGSQFRFHSAQGTYDPDTGAFDAAFSGGVRFLGHRTADGSHRLDLTVARPRVTVRGGTGTLYADVTSRAEDTGRTTTTTRVPLAALNLTGIDTRGGGTPIALITVPATLTAQGARAFAGYYAAGTPLDPVTLSVDVHAPAAPQPSADPDPGPAATAAPSSTTAPAAPGSFRDAAVDWGVRRTFREYVTGPVARGRWTLGGGAQDGGALFRFPKGTGTYDPEGGTLDARFAGSVRFTGAHLDLTLAGITVRVKNGTGTLAADVTASPGRTDKAVPLVTFDAGTLTARAGLAAISEAPAVLTAPGAKVFGSLYTPGTAMDPVSLAVAVDSTARLPALPDLGSDPASAAPATATATTPAPDDPRTTTGTGTGTGLGTGAYAAIGGGMLVVLVLATGYALRRRRASP
ncbi:HtaA domain-containing protein [Streptomyces sp. NPDC047928]|uniref:HtaA domain-containing protein n=1 Tax=unclassified Streptomyces TaxID=2593676 RepID=UPI00371AB72E